MPAERRGTVTDEIEAYIKRVKSSAEWKADRAGNIRMPIGRVCNPLLSVFTHTDTVFHCSLTSLSRML